MGRYVPWRSWGEWEQVRRWLYAEDDRAQQQFGVDRVSRLGGSVLGLGHASSTHLLRCQHHAAREHGCGQLNTATASTLHHAPWCLHACMCHAVHTCGGCMFEACNMVLACMHACMHACAMRYTLAADACLKHATWFMHACMHACAMRYTLAADASCNMVHACMHA
eukprot:366313-Chlamydomonas_euryale.AAC.12